MVFICSQWIWTSKPIWIERLFLQKYVLKTKRRKRRWQALLSGKVGIVRRLFGVVFRYDRIVAGRVHRGLSVDSVERRSRAWHGHRHWHLLHGLVLRLGWIRLRRVANSGCRVVAGHGLRHRLRHGLRAWLLHRINPGSGAVLLHDHTGWGRRRTGVNVHRIRTYVVLGGCDHHRSGNHGTLVSPSPTAHPAQREEHKQNEKDDDRNEDIHRCLVVFWRSPFVTSHWSWSLRWVLVGSWRRCWRPLYIEFLLRVECLCLLQLTRCSTLRLAHSLISPYNLR